MFRIACALLSALACISLARAAAPDGTAAPPHIELHDYRGRVVVIDFWASWCQPCRRSIPWLNEMHRLYATQGLTIIGVNVDAERAAAERFLRDVPVNFTVLFDPAGRVASEYRLMGMPTSLVFGRDGALVGRHVGFRTRDAEAREADLRKLLSIPSEAK